MTAHAKWKFYTRGRWVPLSEQGAAMWLSGTASHYDPDEVLEYTDRETHHEWKASEILAMVKSREPAKAGA